MARTAESASHSQSSVWESHINDWAIHVKPNAQTPQPWLAHWALVACTCYIWHTLIGAGTYPLGETYPLPASDIMLQECPPSQSEYTRWCGLEGQVLNHLRPLPGKGEYSMGAANGQYSAALWPRTCEQNGTVAGAWTQPTLHGFLSFLDEVGVRSVDVWCTNAEMPCGTVVGSGKSGAGAGCEWFAQELAWWKSNGV